MFIPDKILGTDEKATFALRALYGRYGYSQYKMSKFEEYDLYADNKDFLVSNNIITFTGLDGRLLALKPDVTLSIVKSTPDNIAGVRKVCYNENVYRVPRGGLDYKEIMQLGLECIGEVDEYCVSEAITLACESLALLSEDYTLDVSHIGLLSSALARTGASEETAKRLSACVAGKNPGGLDSICADQGIAEEKARALKELAVCRGTPGEIIPRLYGIFGDGPDREPVASLERVLKAVPGGKVNIDFSVSGDMNYYNGIVFNGFIKGLPYALLSGGQYDNLLVRMGKKFRAVGFAIYIDMLDELDKPSGDYDVDTVLIYEPGTPAGEVASVLAELQKEVPGAAAFTRAPEKLKYRRAVSFDERKPSK